MSPYTYTDDDDGGGGGGGALVNLHVSTEDTSPFVLFCYWLAVVVKY